MRHIYYKMRQLLQIATISIQNASYYKMRQYTVHQFNTYYIYSNKKIHLFTHKLNYFSELYEVIYGPGTISFQERSPEDVLSERFS